MPQPGQGRLPLFILGLKLQQAHVLGFGFLQAAGVVKLIGQAIAVGVARAQASRRVERPPHIASLAPQIDRRFQN